MISDDKDRPSEKSRIRVVGWLVLSLLALSGAAWDSHSLAFRLFDAAAFVYCVWQAIVIWRSRRAVHRRT